MSNLGVFKKMPTFHSLAKSAVNVASGAADRLQTTIKPNLTRAKALMAISAALVAGDINGADAPTKVAAEKPTIIDQAKFNELKATINQIGIQADKRIAEANERIASADKTIASADKRIALADEKIYYADNYKKIPANTWKQVIFSLQLEMKNIDASQEQIYQELLKKDKTDGTEYAIAYRSGVDYRKAGDHKYLAVAAK